MRALLAALLLTTACWSTDSRIALHEEQTRDAMVEHHKELLGARDAVIAGELGVARSALRALATRLPIEQLEGPAQEPLKTVATRGALAEDIDAAALAVGEAAAICGSCHKANGARPPAEAGPAPTVGDDLKSQMALHRWAALSWWDGVIDGDPAAVSQAAEALRGAPLIPSGTQVDSPLPAELTPLAVRVHDLAGRAARAPDQTTRGRLLGEALGTCARCHVLAGGGPGASK